MFLIFGLFYLVIFAISIGGLIVWIWMLIDVATRPAWQFPDARPDSQNKVLWILIVALGGWIGALIYYFMILKKAGKANSSLPAPPWWFQPPPGYPQPGMAYGGQPYAAQPGAGQPYPQPGPPPPYAAQPYPQPGPPPPYAAQPYPQPGPPQAYAAQAYPLPPGISAPDAIEAPGAHPPDGIPAQTPSTAETQRLPHIEPPTHSATQD
ncbi:MAG: hypothetical protein DCC49_04445 [Acidobacteria bacterium]|nr:MAG: hypothetical protein DCC49_04445 [Acidobacteriota bacterium]